ncbi:zinc-binding dehydrogenase [Streptomyces lydicus]
MRSCAPLSTGFVAAEHAELALGETAAVFAQGAVGLSATIGCGLLGAGLIIAVESVPARQELARRFGADLIVDHTQCDQVARIMELTDGQGVDAAIEAPAPPLPSRLNRATGKPARRDRRGTAPSR